MVLRKRVGEGKPRLTVQFPSEQGFRTFTAARKLNDSAWYLIAVWERRSRVVIEVRMARVI